MNAIQLIRPDNGQPADMWACGKCNRLCQCKEVVEACCSPCHTCGKPPEPTGIGTCWECRSNEFAESERARLANLASKAKRDPDWSGWVFSDEYSGGNDGFFDSPEEFMEQLNDDIDRDPDLGRPEFVWATVSGPIVNIGVDDVLGLITEDRPENWNKDDLNGVDELKAAINAFNAANPSLMYEPDRRVIVPLNWKETN